MINKKRNFNYSPEQMWDMLDDPMLEKTKQEVLKFPVVHGYVPEKYINITLKSEKEKLSINENQFKEMMESDNQIYLVNDEKGNFTGRSINKTEIKTTEPDVKRTNDLFKTKLQRYAEIIHGKIKEDWDGLSEEIKSEFINKQKLDRQALAEKAKEFALKMKSFAGENNKHE